MHHSNRPVWENLVRILGTNFSVKSFSLHTVNQVFDTSWMSYNSTEFWHCLPEGSFRFRGYGLSPIRLPPLLTPSKPRPSCSLTNQLQPWVLTPSTLSSINLLMWLTKLRKTLCLLDQSLVNYKRVWLKNSQLKGPHRAKHGERTWSFHTLFMCPILPNPQVLTNLEALWALFFRVFMVLSLQRAVCVCVHAHAQLLNCVP